jgi:diaminopimelate decarboxylase
MNMLRRHPDVGLLHRIALEIGTPFYIYDAGVLRMRVKALCQAFPAVNFFFSLKANPNLSVTRILHEQGIGCEVSSELELETAVAAGVPADRILMVGPGKTRAELERAVQLQIKSIVAESLGELLEIDRLGAAKGTVQGVAIRINPDFRSSGARLTMSGRASQFGIDQPEVRSVLSALQGLANLQLRGLHAYMGSRILSHEAIAHNIRDILNLAAGLLEELGTPLDFVDVGGGFGVPYYEGEEELDLNALSAAVAPLLSTFALNHPRTRVVMELGRFIVAPAGRFITAIRQTKWCKGERFAVCDGGSNVHSAAAGQGSLLSRNFPVSHLGTHLLEPDVHALEAWTLTGPLCTPQDIIGKAVMLAQPRPGDLICIHQSGAYGPTASPTGFLGFGFPAEVLVDEGIVQLVRARDTVGRSLSLQKPRPILPREALAAPHLAQRANDPLINTAFSHPCLDKLSTLEPLFRRTGERLDTDPDAWGDLWESDLVRALTMIGVPAAFNGFPLGNTDLEIDTCSYGLHVAMVERLARFDASSILALPGPSLSGGAVLTVGNPEQITQYFKAYSCGPQGTFFAVTEPDSGSDALNGRTRISRQGEELVINGTKMLVGGAKRAEIGLVFGQREETGRATLAMVEPKRWPDHVRIDRLKTVGLRGADLCRITFTDFPVSREMILGDDERSLRDGFMSISGVFERNRPMVAALALGSGRGILDRLDSEPKLAGQFRDLRLTHTALLRQLARVIDAYEQRRPKAHEISAIKLQAVAFADRVVERVYDAGSVLLLSDQILRRRCRDLKAFEYMEGTTNIHTLNAYRSYTAGVAK